MKPWTARFFDWSAFPARYPWWTLLLAAPIVAWAGFQVARLRPVASLRNITSGDDAAAQALNLIVEDFGVTDELLLLVGAPAQRGGDVAQIQTGLLAFARRLQSSLEGDVVAGALCGPIHFQTPPDFRAFVERVMVPRALHYVDAATAQALRKRLSPDAMRIQIRRHEQGLAAGGGGVIGRAQLQDILGLRDMLAPALAARFGALPQAMSFPESGRAEGANFSADGRVLLMRIGGLHPVSDLAYARALTRTVCDRAFELNAEGFALDFAGAYPIAAFAEQSIRADMIRSIVLALVLLQILFWIVFRDLTSFPLAMVPVVCGCLVGFGVYAAWSTELTPMTAAVGAVLAGLGVDYAIHVLSHYRHLRRAGWDAETAVRRLLAIVGPAMVTACGTSVLGLLVVARSQVPALREFALLGALGLAGSLLATLTLLPAILVLVDRRRRIDKDQVAPPMASSDSRDFAAHSPLPRRGWLEFLALREFDFLPRILALFFAGIVVTAIWHGWPEFDDDLTVLHPRPNAPLQAQQRIADEFGDAADPLLVYLNAESPQEVLALAHATHRRLMQSDIQGLGIGGIHSLATWLPDPRTSAAPAHFLTTTQVDAVLTDFDTALAESIFEPAAFGGYRSFLGQLLAESRKPSWEDVDDFPGLARTLLPKQTSHQTPPRGRSLMTLFVNRHMATRAQRDRAIGGVRAALLDFPGATLTGVSVIGHDAEAAIRREITRVAEPSTALVLIWVLIYFRRLGASCLAILPAAVGFAAMIAAMHLLGWKLNMINLIGVAIFAGIGVDNGVLLVSLARKRGIAGEALKVNDGDWRTALSAMSLTTLSTVLGFAALCVTQTPGIQSLGATVTIGMSAAWLASVGLLAPLLRHK